MIGKYYVYLYIYIYIYIYIIDIISVVLRVLGLRAMDSRHPTTHSCGRPDAPSTARRGANDDSSASRDKRHLPHWMFVQVSADTGVGRKGLQVSRLTDTEVPLVFVPLGAPKGTLTTSMLQMLALICVPQIQKR